MTLVALLAVPVGPSRPAAAAGPTPKPAPNGQSAAPTAGTASGGPVRGTPAPASGSGGSGSLILGAVLLDQNTDGAVSRGDRPVVGLGVRLSGPLSASTATGADGTFAFGGLPAGTYTVSIGVPGGAVATNGTARVVTVDGRSGARADFLLTRADGAPPSGLAAPLPPTPTAAPTVTPKPLPTSVSAPGAPTPSTAASARSGQGGGSGNPVAGDGSASRPSPGSGGQAAPRPLVNSPVQYAPGLTNPSSIRVVRTDRALWLGVPFISQLDGTTYGGVNCGPATIAMVLGAFGIRTGPVAIRTYINQISGNYSPDIGTSLEDLARVARESGLEATNLYAPGGGYLRWSTTLLRQQIEAGRPVLTLVKYRALPSNRGSLSDFDHYIVVAGLSGDDFIYNDAAFTGDRGYGLLISPADLERAWDYSSIPRQGMAVGLNPASPAARERLPEAADEAPLDLGTELAADALAADDVRLGDAVGTRGDFGALTWRRVELDSAPSNQPAAEGELDPGAAPIAGSTAAPVADASGLANGSPLGAALGQPRPLQEVAGPAPAPPEGAATSVPLLVSGLLLLLGCGGWASRRLFF